MGDLGLLAQELSDAITVANRQLDNRFVEAMGNKDIETAMTCFLDSPDLVVVLYGNALRGPTAVRQFLADLFSRMKTIQLRINEVSHWSLAGTIFAVGIATYQMEALDGTRSKLKECWTDARQKVAGKWVYVLNHATQIP